MLTYIGYFLRLWISLPLVPLVLNSIMCVLQWLLGSLSLSLEASDSLASRVTDGGTPPNPNSPLGPCSPGRLPPTMMLRFSLLREAFPELTPCPGNSLLPVPAARFPPPALSVPLEWSVRLCFPLGCGRGWSRATSSVFIPRACCGSSPESNGGALESRETRPLP